MAQVEGTDVRHYEYYGRTLKIERRPDGSREGVLLNWDTGEFEQADDRVLFQASTASTTSDISGIDEEEFIRSTEEIRRDQLTGDGPIFALYAAIATLFAHKDAEGRRFSVEEYEVITLIRRRTFAMWEEEMVRRARGEQPTFTARPKTDADV
jgi:hypothetical protein